MTTFLSEELSNNYIIFQDRISGEHCAVESKKWDSEYRYNEKRFTGDEPLMVKVEMLDFDTTKNEYFRTGKTRIIKHFDLKSDLIERWNLSTLSANDDLTLKKS